MSKPRWSAPLEPACAALATLFHPHVEVALHDLASDRILAMWNPAPGRSVGDPSLLGSIPSAVDVATLRSGAVLGPYERVLVDGRRTASVSAVVPGPTGAPVGLVCINFDRSLIDGAAASLLSFARAAVDRPPELFDRDWREQIALTVEEWLREKRLRREALTRTDRVAVVRLLDERELFATRNASRHVALALGISRASVYTLLRTAREGSS